MRPSATDVVAVRSIIDVETFFYVFILVGFYVFDVFLFFQRFFIIKNAQKDLD